MGVRYHLNYMFFEKPMVFEAGSLYQIGRMYCDKNQEIGEHIHRDIFELTIVTEGEGQIFANKIATRVKSGDIYLSLPCDSHNIISDSENPLKYDFIAFGDVESEFNGQLQKISENYFSPHTRVFHDERIRQIIVAALSEIQEEKAYSPALLSSLFKQLLIYLIRSFQNVKPDKHLSAASDAQILCYRLMNYIDTHIYSIKNLKELEKITDYSYGYLSAVFKNTTSNTLCHYYMEKKLDAARLLILENDLTITQIAEMLGYASVYAFSKAFSGRFNMSPRAYREAFMNKDA